MPAGDLRVTFDAKRRALVTIRARVTTDLLATIKTLGGDVVSSSERDNDIRAYLPLGKLEELAASKTVSRDYARRRGDDQPRRSSPPKERSNHMKLILRFILVAAIATATGSSARPRASAGRRARSRAHERAAPATRSRR